MKNLLTLIRLKLLLFAAHPWVLLFCLIVPVCLSLLAGSTAEGNHFARVRGGFVDLAKNEASARLTGHFDSGLLDWVETDEREGRRMLLRHELDGLVIIPARYGTLNEGDAREDAFECAFVPGTRAAASDLVREHFMMSSLVMSIQNTLMQDLLSAAPGTTKSSAMFRQLLEETERAREDGHVVNVLIHSFPEGKQEALVMLPDFVVEIMFLSIFALLGRMMTSSRPIAARLAAVPGGFRREFLSNLVTLAVTGLIETGLMVGLSSLLMPETVRPIHYYPVMLAYYILLLALGQLFSSFSDGDRLVSASLLLFFSMLAGGAFIRLPSVWILRFGQFTPHGWALAQMDGIPTVFSVPAIILFSAAIFFVSYFLLKRRARGVK